MDSHTKGAPPAPATLAADDIGGYATHAQALNDSRNDPYADSPFKMYRDMSSKRKGAYGERIFAEYAAGRGHTVKRATSSDHDRRVDGVAVEVKTSFMWLGTEEFRWSQIRTDQDYDILAFLAVYPDRIEFWAATKADADAHLDVQDSDGRYVNNQHGGAGVDSGTTWVAGLPEDIAWFRPLDDVLPPPAPRDGAQAA